MTTSSARPAEPTSAPQRRRRHLPLGLLLALLVLIPTTGFAALGLQRVEAERAHADDAVEVVEVVELQRAVGQVYPAAQVERIAMQGLARIDALGVPRQLVVSFAGVDLEAYDARNKEQLDRALDELAGDYGTYPIGGGAVLSEALEDFRSRLATTRELSARREADADEVERLFDDLVDVLGQALDTAPSPDEASTEHASQRLRLDALSNALVSGGEQVEVVLESALDGSASERVERATAVHAADLDTLVRLVDDEHRSTFSALRAELADLPRLPALSDAELENELAAAVNPALIADTATVIVAEIEYLEHLRSAAAEYQAAVASDVAAAADRAAARSQQVQVVVWTTISVTFVLIVLIVWSVLGSIHRLTQRAAAIGNGELDLEPLPVRGPREVQRLTATMNGMHDVLQRANSEIQRLATGDLERPAVSLPGAIGEALRDSVKHLAEVTGRLQRSEQLASAIVSQAGDAIWTVDRDERIRSVNHAGEVLVGLAADAQVGRTLSEFLTTDEGVGGEGVVANVRGTEAKVLVSSHTVELEDEPIVTVIAHDISERSKFEQRLHYQAHHDALTGLPNRFAVLEHLEHAVTEDRSLAVLFVDLDGFKNVNDIHGHAVGDRVLADVARRLARNLAPDEFLGRLGGDEFVVVTAGGADDAVRLGQRLIADLERPQEHDGKTFSLSASVGVSISFPGTSALDAIRQADNAVYQAKHRGRGRVEVFDQSMQEQMEHDAELELALRHAVRNGELTLHYQPVLDLVDGRIVSAEALVRWQRPGFETIMPGDFIPIAERTALIFEIERWVLHETCRRLAEWRERSPDLDVRVAVNISGRHLIQGRLLEDVDATLAATGADPAMLEFELTETQLVEDVERATTILAALRRRGIRIAIDDFGTGYSSMTYLRELPIDIVKIDRSFVARSPDHAYDATVIDALVTIGKALRLEIVAEGVETADQLADVRARGCDRAQGFLLGRPGPVDELEARMFVDSSFAPVG